MINEKTRLLDGTALQTAKSLNKHNIQFKIQGDCYEGMYALVNNSPSADVPVGTGYLILVIINSASLQPLLPVGTRNTFYLSTTTDRMSAIVPLPGTNACELIYLSYSAVVAQVN